LEGRGKILRGHKGTVIRNGKKAMLQCNRGGQSLRGEGHELRKRTVANMKVRRRADQHGEREKAGVLKAHVEGGVKRGLT